LGEIVGERRIEKIIKNNRRHIFHLRALKIYTRR